MSAAGDPVRVSIGDYEVRVSNAHPIAWEHDRGHATTLDEIGSPEPDGALVVVDVRTGVGDFPQLLVALRYSPSGPGFTPAVLVVPETGLVLLGAGRTLLAYRAGVAPTRLWQDSTEPGFWGWRRHDAVVVMSAELELAAWDLDGQKLWACFVEPPWTYEVVGDRVDLDVMGVRSTFGLRRGPD